MLFNYSLSHNKQPLTCTTLEDCGFYSVQQTGVLCEVRTECLASLQSVNVIRTTYWNYTVSIVPWSMIDTVDISMLVCIIHGVNYGSK